jgi:hypothetical protein
MDRKGNQTLLAPNANTIVFSHQLFYFFLIGLKADLFVFASIKHKKLALDASTFNTCKVVGYSGTNYHGREEGVTYSE